MSDYLLQLPRDLKINVLAKLSYLDIARLRGVCKAFRELPASEDFQSELLSAGHVPSAHGPLQFFWQDGGLEWRGFSSTLHQWRRLPSLRDLVPPRSSEALLKEYLVTTSGGFLCMDVSGGRTSEQIILVNPLTRRVTELPPLIHRRRPVVMSLIVDVENRAYQVLIAGSAAAGDESLSKKTEVYDSVTGSWEVLGDIPGPPYGVNLFQSGVLLNGLVFCLGFHLVLACDVKLGEWASCPFPDEFFELGYAGTNQQLFQCGKGDHVVLFWEKARSSEPAESSFCFASLKWSEVSEPEWGGLSVYTRFSGSGLDSYPEYVCCSYGGTRQAVILNTVELTAEKYELEASEERCALPGPPALKENEEVVYTLNPLTFSFEPSYDMNWV